MSFWHFIKKKLFNLKLTCNACGREIFDGDYFCKDCKNALPVNDREICDHCGRALKVCSDYCITCKNFMVSVDKARSAFIYEGVIIKLILDFKYKNKRYLGKVFSEYLAPLYYKNYFNADVIAYIPSDKKTFKRRGYNQAEILADELSKLINLPVLKDVFIKKSPSDRTGKTRAERLKIKDTFKITDKKSVKDKVILLVDDVTTTGATAEAAARLFKEKGAKTVYLLTVASVSSKIM